MKSWRKISDIDVLRERRTGITRGYYVGFKCLSDLMSIKLGCTSYWYGSPTHGKTEFWLEILMNLSELHGLRHAIWTPETGTAPQVAAELISKYLRKEFYHRATEQEILAAQEWVDAHFIIIDEDGEAMSVEEFYAFVDDAEDNTGKIHTTTVDPWNEFYHSFAGYSGREDKYLEQKLGWIRLNARAKNRHNALITHIQHQAKKERDGIEYYPYADAREMAGGQAWYRKGELMGCVWRPPHIDGEYEMNEAHIIVQKAKPKWIGDKGTGILYFDREKNRYFERVLGVDKYARAEELVYEQMDAPW